jgi:hypothetical protein
MNGRYRLQEIGELGRVGRKAEEKRTAVAVAVVVV